jgi:hypothetical protein
MHLRHACSLIMRLGFVTVGSVLFILWFVSIIFLLVEEPTTKRKGGFVYTKILYSIYIDRDSMVTLDVSIDKQVDDVPPMCTDSSGRISYRYIISVGFFLEELQKVRALCLFFVAINPIYLLRNIVVSTSI